MPKKKRPATSTPRVRTHRELLARVGLRYRSILVHDDDVAAVQRYAARKLKNRTPAP
jgi:hypothetical protein